MTKHQISPELDPDRQSVPEYILGTTWEVWEARGLSGLADMAIPEVILRDAGSVRQGIGPMRQHTLETLAVQPDLALLGEDVIWCPTATDKDKPAGFYASHRMTATATHLGDGAWGAATGAKLRYRVMCDSWCAENRLQDRWSLHDTGAALRQIGTTPRDWVTAQLDTVGLPAPLSPDTDIEGPYFGHGNHAAPSDELREILTSFMEADFSVVSTHYDRACDLARRAGSAISVATPPNGSGCPCALPFHLHRSGSIMPSG